MKATIAAITAAALTLIAAPAIAQEDQGYIIAHSSWRVAILNQCSRLTPEPGEGGWNPTDADVQALERALPGALVNQRHHAEVAGAPEGWLRQYVGIVRGGRKYIYGDFAPPMADMIEGNQWRKQPIIVCDGGPQFFGVEYDVDARVFTHFAFNGI